MVEEAHFRISQAFVCMAAALIGFATLLTGGFSRFGVWRQIVLAIVLLLVVKAVEGLASEPVRDDPALWPLIYSTPLAGFALGFGMLWVATRSNEKWFRRRRAPVQVAP